MALETVIFQQEPFSCGCCKCNDIYISSGLEEGKVYQETLSDICACSAFSVGTVVKESETNSFSQERSAGGEFFTGEVPPAISQGRRKRRRSKNVKNMEQIEHQRMVHITVERNRRKQMSEYLTGLRSMMPSSYVQRGDQASIVGGAINFVKDLERLLQSMEIYKRNKKQTDHTNTNNPTSLFSEFFLSDQSNSSSSTVEKKSSAIADVEVTMVENHANVRVRSRRHPKQLVKMVSGLHSLRLTILHLNVTTAQHMVLYSFSVKVEDECKLSSVKEVAAAVYAMVGRIQEESISD
ncbi:hypothetical protein K2173_014872 [Erythroxylum novogranatense]|uniref:BHLH domain-containing protein n=1 Tax=Erythroxylum novogranatense TaxID=1862640 RepID=A0AAV8TI92_9ROSI|nr:hypothetical protein K2173_014872 [Erythroxylum novogranatense]